MNLIPLCFSPVLSSVGEKLDYKSCESLEEIFKRVQFKVVDLEQTNLDEDVSVFHHFYLRVSGSTLFYSSVPHVLTNVFTITRY